MNSISTRVRRWLMEAALPLWADAGIDKAGGFTERLLLDGSPDWAAPKRLRVQARQIYVFSHAHLLGLMPNADAIAAHGYAFVMRHGAPDGIKSGFVRALNRTGGVHDEIRDTYDHAFLLFAFSWFYRATGDADTRSAIMALGDVIWTLLRHSRGEGFIIDSAQDELLQQNPHMHLLEAVLAAYDATGEDVFLERARELFRLFRCRMFDFSTGVLREFYGPDWAPAAGDAGRIVEPGHHCEWVWLLKWYADRIGEPLCDEAYRLHDFAQRYGRSAGSNLMCDELWTDGAVKKASTRSWPQTEALKAEIALAQVRGKPLGPRSAAIVEALFATFLDRPIRGGWIDWVDASGRPLVQAIPASTFYHVFLAFSEYLRVEPA